MGVWSLEVPDAISGASMVRIPSPVPHSELGSGFSGLPVQASGFIVTQRPRSSSFLEII